MADMIQLTPAELLSQANGMKALYDQYTDLFKNVEGLLNTINASWSPNLANNFVSKITSAQNAFGTILVLLESGINVAETAANTFESVDSALANLFNGTLGEVAKQAGSGILQDIASQIGIDPEMITTLTPQMYEQFVDACKKGDFSSITDLLMPGLTDELKDKVIDVIKDKTGLTVDPVDVYESFKNGDYVGGLLDIAEASVDIGNLAGGYSSVGIATDFLLQTTKIVLDKDGFATTDTEIYSERILDAWENGDPIGVISGGLGYVLDVPGRVLLSAVGDTASNVVDSATKQMFGVSLSEFNDKLEDTIGFNPGKVVQNIGSAIGDTYHDIVSGDGVSDFISSTVKTGGKVFSGIASGFKKLF